MWWIAIQIIVDIALALTAALLTARKGTSSKPGSFDPPTSDQATPVAVVFGTCVVTPQVMLWHNPQAYAFQKKGQDAGFTYHAELLLGICYGPVDAIRDFVLDTTKLLSAVAPTRGLPVCTPALPITRPGDGLERDLVVYAEGAFGGPDHEGGIAGTMHLYFGTDAQTADPAMNFNLGSPPGVAVLPPYRRLCYAAFLDNGPALSTVRDFYFGTSSSLKAINVLVTRCPNRLGHGAMPNGRDANPVECIYDVLVDDWWGLAMPTALFGSSWATAAQTVQTEGTGSSRSVNDASLTAEEVIAEFLREIDASVYTDPVTGLIEIQLVRAGDPVTFWVDADAVHDVEYTQPTWRDVGATGVKVKFSNRAKLYADDIAEWQNPGAVAALGQEITQEIALPGITDATVAAAIAAREGRVATQPFARVTFKCDRRAYAFHKGTPFRFSDPELTGTSDRIFRAGAIDYGDLTDPTITVTAVEDVFGSAGAGSGVGSGSGTGSPVAPTPAVSAPDVVASTTETATAETITLTVTDLFHLITATHGAVWQTQVAGGALSAATDFVQAWPGPYSVTINKLAVAQTFTWTVNYLDAAGAAQTITGTVAIVAAATPLRPALTLNVDPTTGAVTVGWTGDPLTTGVKIAASKTGYPSDATTRATALLAGQTGTTGTLVTLAAGEFVYVTAFAYTSDTPPLESAHAQATNATSAPGTYLPAPASPAANTFLKYVSGVWSAVLLALADLPGQITTTRKFLTSAGNGTTAGVPFYDTLGASDIPSIPSSRLSDLGSGSGAASLASGVVPWAQLPTSARNAAVNAILDNGSSALTTQEMEAHTNTPGTIIGWRVLFPRGVSGSVSIDVYKATFANGLTNTWTKISASAPISVSSAAGNSSSTLTGWTTAIADGDVLLFVVTSATTATRATVALEIQRS